MMPLADTASATLIRGMWGTPGCPAKRRKIQYLKDRTEAVSIDKNDVVDDEIKYYQGDTIKNLKIDENTRIVYQGFTGKQATVNAQQTIDYGTKVVGGVSPNKGGSGATHLGLPVFKTIEEAARELKPHATAVFVPALSAAGAIEAAIEAEIPLIVSVAEHVPIHDMLRINQILRAQSASRLVGPNCPGIIAAEACRIGIMPHLTFRKGCVGIVSKSGTLSYEAVGSTSNVGLGQSITIGMGGDPMPGTDFVDALKMFLKDPQTKGIIVIGEIGGEAEFEAAAFLEENNIGPNKKPVVGLVAGLTAPFGRAMGHAGAVRLPWERSADEKRKALERAGARIVVHPGETGQTMIELFKEAGIDWTPVPEREYSS
ncbi:hypothetical protein G7K_0610-t1 [Saitoella complicata NRRL Y-17804]|uniref:CoA-binding domain-containing protein n=1 Tax=Saitoella complicata (strain BCRC 22490 / CBS 7301 / JCM 7358 / NBRC 10748 / NRRL Y-17804) TaxID=698492 RepID=A0A0E9N991_SAICN|nr:hypothetical protein G7K_0610-t1 [Saitoella complicata NRRL Y-17804]